MLESFSLGFLINKLYLWWKYDKKQDLENEFFDEFVNNSFSLEVGKTINSSEEVFAMDNNEFKTEEPEDYPSEINLNIENIKVKKEKSKLLTEVYITSNIKNITKYTTTNNKDIIENGLHTHSVINLDSEIDKFAENMDLSIHDISIKNFKDGFNTHFIVLVESHDKSSFKDSLNSFKSGFEFYFCWMVQNFYTYYRYDKYAYQTEGLEPQFKKEFLKNKLNTPEKDMDKMIRTYLVLSSLFVGAVDPEELLNILRYYR